jgi:hypothetical protein
VSYDSFDSVFIARDCYRSTVLEPPLERVGHREYTPGRGLPENALGKLRPADLIEGQIALLQECRDILQIAIAAEYLEKAVCCLVICRAISPYEDGMLEAKMRGSSYRVVVLVVNEHEKVIPESVYLLTC